MAEHPTIGINKGFRSSELSQNDSDDVQSRVSDLSEFRQAQKVASINSGITKNPDSMGQVSNLADQTGLDEGLIERQQDEIEKRVKALQLLDSDVGRRAPTVTSRLNDPRFVGMTHDDMENLVQTEEWMRNKDLGYLEKIAANYRKNVALVKSSDIGVARWQAQLGLGDDVSERELLRLDSLERDTAFTHDTGFFAGIPIESVGMLPMVFDVLAEGGIAGAGGAVLGGAIGFAATRTPAGAAAGARFGGGLAFKLGVFHSVFNIESGLAYNDYASVDGIDLDMAAKASIVVGAINGSLEFLSLSLIGRTVTPAIRSVIRSRVRRMMATESGRAVIQRIAGRYLTAAAGEGITEGMQEVSTMAGEVFSGIFKEGEEVTADKIGEAFDAIQEALPEIIKSEEVKGAAIVGVQAGLGLSFPGTVASSITQTRGKKTKTGSEQEKIDKIVELSVDAKLRPRSGRVYRQTIEEIAEEIEATTGEVNEIYWTAREALKWLEAEGIDISEPPPNAAVASIIEQLSDALATDGDIVLSIADFATDIAPSENFAETVRAHVKMSSDTFTQEEIGNIDETVERRIKQLIEDAKITVEQQRQAEVVAELVTSQLVDTKKLDKDAAKTSAALISNYVLTKAARTGLSVEDVFARMGLEIVGPDAAPLGEDDLEQLSDLAGPQLVSILEEQQKLVEEEKSLDDEGDNLTQVFTKIISTGIREGVDEVDNQDLERIMSNLLFEGAIPLRSSEKPSAGRLFGLSTKEGGTVNSPESLVTRFRELEKRGQKRPSELRDLKRRKEVLNQRFGVVTRGDTRTLKQDTRGQILLSDDATGAIIRLTEAADLSTFLHESGHLFLEMEKRFNQDPNIPEEAKADGQAILDWLGVDSFDDITDEHHEKWAQAFEAYLYDGNAPSSEMRPVFRRFSAWLQKIYQGLRRLDVQLGPEIIGVFDRMLATDEQIAEVKAQMALEPLFKTAEEADMTPKEFSKYQEKSQGRAEEELRKKVLAQLTRTAMKWWREELAAVQDEVREELSALELYRAIAFMRAADPPEGFTENKMDRDTVYQLLGLASPTERRSDPNAVHPDVDSLSVAVAKLGGLDREEAEVSGVDPAHWRPRKVLKARKGKDGIVRDVIVSVPNGANLPAGIGKPLFRKPTTIRGNKARSLDGMREILVELGYIRDDTSSDELMLLLLDDLSGDTVYSLNANLDVLFENVNEVPKERLKAPAQLRGLTKKGGMSPTALAEIFGFASGHQLVKQIMESPTLNFAVERKAHEIMVQRHGDILNDGTLEREATEAAHNTEQGSALLAELRVLSGQTNIQAISERKAIEAAADRIIGGKRITSLRPHQYHAAEVKAAQEAQVAKKAGDLEATQAAKQKQVFNFYLWRAATKAREKADKMQKRLRTMQTKKYPAATVRPDYAGQLKQFLAAYDFRRSNTEARKNGQALLESVKKWIVDQQKDPDSPANIIDASQLTTIIHYRDMTLDQLQAVHDIASSLLNAGRKNSKAEKEEFKANMKIMAEHIAARTIAKKELTIEDTKSRRRTTNIRTWFAYHRKLESFARELDGFEDLGPFWKLIIKPLLDANNKKLKMQEVAHDALEVIFEGHDRLFDDNNDKRSFTLESGRELQLSLGGRISMMLNWGNEGNREAMLNQHDLTLTRKDVETIIATLSASDRGLVQDVWDYIDTFYPEIAQQERELTGIVPVKVEASEFEVNGQIMKGGYYPLVEDLVRGRFTESDAQREARQAREKIGSTSHAMTAHGWTNERRHFAGKSILLSINVVFDHTDAVIHDLTHRKATMDVDRVLSNKDVSDAIRAALGTEAHKAMKNTIVEVAGGHVNTRELSQVQAMLRWSRLAITYAALGFSTKTGFSQMLGFFTAIGEFGGRDVVRRGVIDYLRNQVENRKFIEEHSAFMRQRGKTMHRDVTDILQGLKGSTTMNSVRKKAFFFLLAGDRAISLPVWWGQYQVGMDRVGDPAFEGFVTEQDAIDWADRSVSRTQQSGLLMDLANIESKNEFVKMWTVMYSAFSAIYQIVTEQGKKLKIGKINKVDYVYNIMWILVIPPLFEELMTGRDDDDEDIIGKRGAKAIASFTLGLMAGLRETGWLVESGRNSQLPVQRILKAPFDLATQVEQFELDAALIRSMAAIPQFFHIPGGAQLTRSAQYLLALEEGDEEGFDVWEFLVTGPREETDEARRRREDSQ